jgi:hypothetical protein
VSSFFFHSRPQAKPPKPFAAIIRWQGCDVFLKILFKPIGHRVGILPQIFNDILQSDMGTVLTIPVIIDRAER